MDELVTKINVLKRKKDDIDQTILQQEMVLERFLQIKNNCYFEELQNIHFSFDIINLIMVFVNVTFCTKHSCYLSTSDKCLFCLPCYERVELYGYHYWEVYYTKANVIFNSQNQIIFDIEDLLFQKHLQDFLQKEDKVVCLRRTEFMENNLTIAIQKTSNQTFVFITNVQNPKNNWHLFLKHQNHFDETYTNCFLF